MSQVGQGLRKESRLKKKSQTDLESQSQQGQAWAVVGIGDTGGFVSRRREALGT